MIPSRYIKMALRSIGSAKWRSFLTMLGVLIGVLSVVTIVSLGEGVRQQISRQVNQAGPDLVTVRPGQLVSRDDNGNVVDVNLLSVLGSGSLNDDDIKTVNKTKNVGTVVPFSLINGLPTYEKKQLSDALVIGTNSDVVNVLSRKLLYGTNMSAEQNGGANAVIGLHVAERLFGENAPIGKSFTLRDQSILVVGVMEKFDSNPLSPGIDYNSAIFIPREFARKISDNNLQNYQLLVKPEQPDMVSSLVESLTQRLKSAHGGQEDFTVLQAADNLAIASNVLNLLTALVAGIAAISLLVGGIGIMNIMLVAVSERTFEIGIRKSIGATNYQILSQFFIESVVLSGLGGVLGILGSLLANYLIRLTTSLEPALDWQIMVIAFAVSVLVGSFFGLVPAAKAARKDPIESLRRNN